MRRFVLYGLLSLCALGAGPLACGTDDNQNSTTTDPCPQGICGTTVSSGAGGSTTSSGSGGGGAGASGSTGAGGACVESWACTTWDTNGNGNTASRTCTDTNNCGTTKDKPSETATLPALDYGYFQCNIEPILDRKCSMVGCHGTETGRALRVYSRGRHRHPGETLTDAALCAGSQSASATCDNSISCPCTAAHTQAEWQKNYDSARGFAIDAAGNPIPAGMEDTSELIAQPVVGGKAHAGIHLFKKGDPDHQALVNWLKSAGQMTNCNTQFN